MFVCGNRIWDKDFLFSFDCPGTHSVDQAVLQLRDPPLPLPLDCWDNRHAPPHLTFLSSLWTCVCISTCRGAHAEFKEERSGAGSFLPPYGNLGLNLDSPSRWPIPDHWAIAPARTWPWMDFSFPYCSLPSFCNSYWTGFFTHPSPMDTTINWELSQRIAMLLVPLSAGSILHCALQTLGPSFHLFSSHAALRSAESPLCPGCGPQILLPSFLWLVRVAIAQVPAENILASTSREVFLGKCIHSFKLSRPPAICCHLSSWPSPPRNFLTRCLYPRFGRNL